MKSCLTTIFSIFLLIGIWWGYNAVIYHIDCEDCAKKTNNFYPHFKNWDKTEYYTLDCFCDTKSVLKGINEIRKKIMALRKGNFALLKDDFEGSGKMGNRGGYSGSHDDVPWEEVRKYKTVGVFELDKSDFKRLSYMLFEYKWDTLLNKQVQTKQLNKSVTKVVYNVDYEELNQSVLNKFAQTVFKDSTRFRYPTCVYHLYNRQNKKVEATMKYEDNGKGFYFEIW